MLLFYGGYYLDLSCFLFVQDKNDVMCFQTEARHPVAKDGIIQCINFIKSLNSLNFVLYSVTTINV